MEKNTCMWHWKDMAAWRDGGVIHSCEYDPHYKMFHMVMVGSLEYIGVGNGQPIEMMLHWNGEKMILEGTVCSAIHCLGNVELHIVLENPPSVALLVTFLLDA